MKRMFGLFLVILILCAYPAYAEETVPRVTLLDDNFLPDRASNSFTVMPDGGLLIAGRALGLKDGSDAGSIMVRLDAEGAMAGSTLHSWKHDDEYFRSIVQFADGTIMTDNMTYKPGASPSVFYDVLTTLSEGQVVAEHAIEKDQVFLFQGKNCALIHGVADIKRDKHGGKFYVYYLAAIDQNFNTLWRREFTDQEIRLQGILPTEDGYFAYGYLEEQETGQRCEFPTVMKLSDTGETQWYNQVTSDFIAEYRDATLLPDGSLLAVGTYTKRASGTSNSPDCYVGIATRYAADGEVQWHQEYASDAYGTFFAIEPSADGCLVAGSSWYFEDGRAICVTRLDEMGNAQETWKLWDERIRTFSEPVNMLPTPDGWCIVSRIRLYDSEDEVLDGCAIRFDMDALKAIDALYADSVE